MKKATIDNLVDAPWEKVAEVLCDEQYNIDADKLRDGVVSNRFELVSKSDDVLVFLVHTTVYKRKKTGGLDKSKTIETRTENRWSNRAKTLTWDYRGDGGSRFKLKGVYILSERGPKTQMRHEVTVEVGIPLLGKQIEKFVIKEFEKPDPRYQRLMERYLEQL